jgi:hypothetical protein
MFLFLSLFCFVRGFSHHFVSVWPFGFIYKAGRKPISSTIFTPAQAGTQLNGITRSSKSSQPGDGALGKSVQRELLQKNYSSA